MSDTPRISAVIPATGALAVVAYTLPHYCACVAPYALWTFSMKRAINEAQEGEHTCFMDALTVAACAPCAQASLQKWAIKNANAYELTNTSPMLFPPIALQMRSSY